jgi:hypothetical protein
MYFYLILLPDSYRDSFSILLPHPPGPLLLKEKGEQEANQCISPSPSGEGLG